MSKSGLEIEKGFYSLLSLVLTILTAPIWVPLGLYIGLTYHWEDTVPSDEDLDYESDPDYGKEK